MTASRSSSVLCTLAAAAALLMAGCQPAQQESSGGATETPPPSTGAPSSTSSGGNAKIAFVTNNASDFWTIAKKGVEKADQELNNVSVEFRMPAEGTAAEQRRIIDDLLATGVKGIAISPVDPKNETEMINEVSKKALVVTQDSDAPESDRICYVGTDNRAAGRQAGELIKEALPSGGKIMVFVGTLDAQNAKDRYEGIKEALKGSKVQIIDVRTDETDRGRAKSNVSDTLVKYPDVACLVGLWSYNGPAILNAVREAGKINKVKIVCFDEEDETLGGIEEGAIYATVVQQPYEFGYQSVQILADAIGGDKKDIPANKQKIVETLKITKANVAEFSAKLKQLRGK